MASGSTTERDRAATQDRPLAGQESAFLDELGARIAALRTEFEKYVAIRVARLELSFWRGVVAVVTMMLGVVFAIAFVVTAVVFVFSGLAGWLGEVTSKPYVGSLLAGLFGTILVAVGLLVVRRVLVKKACNPGGGGAR